MPVAQGQTAETRDAAPQPGSSPAGSGGPRQQWDRRWGLAIVFALGAGTVLRLLEPDMVLFKFDEATASRQVVDMLQTHVPVAAGTISSVGGAFPPLFDDVMIPPFLVSQSPVVATAYVALLNILALLLGTVLVWRYVGPRAAFLTALLYALSPWAVVSSRKIWDPYVVALFAVLAMWGLLLLAVKRRG